MDPITAIGAATAAFNGIKAGFAAGREVETMSGDIMRWMGAIQAVKQGHEKEKKRKSRFATIEEEALETWIIKKKAETMEEELRNFISMTYGPSAWQDLIRLQAQIRKERLEEQERLKRQREDIITWIFIAGGLMAVMGIVGWMVWLIRSGGGV